MIRPNLGRVFASNAFESDIGHPDTYIPSDPVYPGRVENQYDVGWFVEGVEVTKQPHQWINFFYNNLDNSLRTHASQNNKASAQISYKKNAIVSVDNLLFMALVEDPQGTPSTINTDWTLCFASLEEYSNLFNATSTNYNNHINNFSNPHNVTKDQIDAYDTGEVDVGLGETLEVVELHKLKTDNPHNVTYSQLKVLPTSGGSFTGAVELYELHTRHGVIKPVLGAIRFEVFGTRFGVRADTGLNKDSLNVVSFNNYEVLKIRNNPKFSQTIPDISIPLTGDLNFHSLDFVESIEYRGSAYTYTNFLDEVVSLDEDECGFNKGLQISSSANQTLSLLGLPNVGISVSAVVDGVRTFVFVSSGVGVNLIEVLGATSSIRDIKIWLGELDETFKSSLYEGEHG